MLKHFHTSPLWLEYCSWGGEPWCRCILPIQAQYCKANLLRGCFQNGIRAEALGQYPPTPFPIKYLRRHQAGGEKLPLIPHRQLQWRGRSTYIEPDGVTLRESSIIQRFMFPPIDSVSIYYVQGSRMSTEVTIVRNTDIFFAKLWLNSPDWCGSVDWTLSHKAKGCWFDPQSGHMPGLWVQSPVGVCMISNQSVFMSHTNVSLPLFLLPFPSL